jgi:hypothetical protein
MFWEYQLFYPGRGQPRPSPLLKLSCLGISAILSRKRSAPTLTFIEALMFGNISYFIQEEVSSDPLLEQAEEVL